MRDSSLAVDSMTLRVDAVTTREVGLDDDHDPYGYTDAIALDHTYTRVLLADLAAPLGRARRCGAVEDVLALLDPGQFALLEISSEVRADVAGIALRECCCPCRPVLVCQPLNNADSLEDLGAAVGSRTFFGVWPGGTPDDYDIFGTMTADLRPTWCRSDLPNPDASTASGAAAAGIDITRAATGADVASLPPAGRNEEHLLTLTGGTDFTGSIDLEWIDPDAGVWGLRLSTAPRQNDLPLPFRDPLLSITTVPNNPDTLLPYSTEEIDERLQITSMLYGARIGFIGPWGAQSHDLPTVTSNDAIAQTISSAEPSVSLLASFYRDDGFGGVTGASVEFSAGAIHMFEDNCPADFTTGAIDVFTPELDLTGTAELRFGFGTAP